MTQTKDYARHYLSINSTFPSVIALKYFLGRNPKLNIQREDLVGKKVCEIGFGDGRDLSLLSYLNMDVSGVEPDSEVVRHTLEKYQGQGLNFDLKTGTNMDTGFKTNYFDIVYASASMYYLPSEKFTINDSLREANRITKDNGSLFATFARYDSHVTKNAEVIDKNTLILEDSYYGFRKGQRYHIYNNKVEIEIDLVNHGYTPTYIGDYDVDWFGTRETLFLVIAKKSLKN